jgi:hypothetical protein
MENGTYSAVALQAVIYESPKTGSLICALNHCIVGENDTPTAATIKSYSTLINKDGVVNTRTVDNLKEIFGWDGNDPFWLQENDLASIVHDIVVESEPFTTPSGKSIMTPKVKWINLRGHGAASGMPAPADRRSILAKYGSKFRAVSGGLKPALPPDAPAPVPVPELKFTPPPAQKTLPGLPSPPEPDIADSTQEEAWAALVGSNPGAAQAALETLWFDAIKATRKKAHELTGKDWAKLARQFADNVPY